MNRNEVFSSLDVASISVKLGWAMLEVMVDETPTVQLLVSGSDEDVTGLRIGCVNGAMCVEQPAYGLTPKLVSGHWMEIVLRLPRDWKGAAEMNTTTGAINVRGLVGTDLSIGTVSGDVTAAHLRGMTCTLQTISGKLSVLDVHCDQLYMRSVCSAMKLEGGGFSQGKINNVTGDVSLAPEEPFDMLEAVTVTGNILLEAPLERLDIRHKTVNGHLRVVDVQVTQGGVPVNVSSVSGDLEIIGANS